MKHELKRCPFCGTEAAFEYWNTESDKHILVRVKCVGDVEHALDRWDDTEEEAIETWNERA